MRKVLHVGPETCSVVSSLLKEDETEAWSVEPYDIEDADSHCKNLVSKGLGEILLSCDLSPEYLNKTMPELARVASDGVVLFAGRPGQQRAQVAEVSKFGRPAKMRSASWWKRFFVQTNFEEV
ncbi:hypothetical protein Bca52824_070594 [Brassica carinata]|uniref:Uncharacterized protein n=1 Tax=Brassica carinata TaxID=52824 RepID=A0A8X7Q780_BRACI|nr:hypothetical protein Bca52824_070594 [Brassica carinata]